ncbi:tyrosine-type recombinase/integrase [Duganella fentianensis]|nr:site-specific integrase [Duganella fentianensis]
MVLYIILDKLDVHLPDRLESGQLLTLVEVEELANKCKFTLQELSPDTDSKVFHLHQKTSETVDPLTAGMRLRSIRSYLDWLTKDTLLRIGPTHPRFAGLRAISDIVLGAIDARTPGGGGRNTVEAREGIPSAALERLIEVIHPHSSENPWKNAHAQLRNYLILRWLLSLGIRRGELLTLKVSDINFQTNEVLIPRRADDPADLRAQQPRTKTNDRLLALDEDLAELTRRYVMKNRRAIKGARKHEFLWVANGSGAPLSLSGFHKIFITLRERVPDLPKSLSAHVMRHTWNDVFSAEMDLAGVSEAEEHKMRTRLMGWSDTSSMASVYTRRHIRKKAKDASLALQAKLRLGEKNNGI